MFSSHSKIFFFFCIKTNMLEMSMVLYNSLIKVLFWCVSSTSPPPMESVEEEAGKVIYSNHTYEIVFDSNRGTEEHKQNLRATFAVGNCLTI